MNSTQKKSTPELAAGVQFKDFVKGDDTRLFTKDPASFFMVFNVLNRVRDSISEFRAFLSGHPDLTCILDRTLVRMKEAGYIDLDGDRIIVLRPNPTLDMKTVDFEPFPKLLGVIARRIRDNFMNDPKSAFKNSDEFFWRALPDHPKVRARLFQICSKFRAEIDALNEEIDNDAEIKAERVRLFAFLSGNLEPEDFK